MSSAIAALPLSDRFGNQLVSVRFATEAELGVLEDPVVTPLSLIVVICAAVYRTMLPAVPPLLTNEEAEDFQWSCRRWRARTGAI
jgi:hypothetical protein